jgi:hypothetical protein
MRKTDAEREDRYEIVGDGDAHAMECLQLEIGRLAKRHGVTVCELRVETLTEVDHTST